MAKKAVRQCHSAHHRAEDVALVPLRTRQLGGHRRVSAQHHLQAVDPFAAAGVHLVRHRRRADLARRESLGDQLVAGHQPNGVRHRRRPRAQLHQRRNHVVVQRSRIHLPDAGQNRCETQELGDAPLEFGELGRVAVQQVEHVLRRAHRSLDAAQRIPVDQLAQPGQRDQRLLGRRGESLAERGGLGGDIVAASGHHQVAIGDGPLGEPRRDRHPVREDELQRPPDLQLLHVLGQVAAGHAFVHMLVTGQRVEFLDAGLDVVAQDPFTVRDRRQVDVLEHPLVVGDRLWGHGDAQLRLRAQHGEPQPTLRDDLGLRRPDRDHLGAGVPGGQHIRNAHLVLTNTQLTVVAPGSSHDRA